MSELKQIRFSLKDRCPYLIPILEYDVRIKEAELRKRF